MIRYSSWQGWRIFIRISNQISSFSTPATGLNPNPCSESTDKVVVEEPSQEVISPVERKTEYTRSSKPQLVDNTYKSKMVAKAFESLKNENADKNVNLDESITKADSVESLLAVSELPQFSRRHALKIVSQLADWTASGRVKLSDFEADTRFVKLCRLLGRSLPRNPQTIKGEGPGFGDLAVVLGVTGDDEAAKLVAGISLSQMIRITSSLAQKQRRSTPLLRSLAFNISKQSEKLNLKNCADLLYAMAVLNFPDDMLLEKTSLDLCDCLASNQKPAVVRSILTSFGLLRYKNIEVLDVLADWILAHIEVCRTQDLTSLVLTLASVNHVPANADKLFEAIVPHLSMQDAPNPSVWLDIVWSLVVLGQATAEHISSVLDSQFHSKLAVTSILDESQKLNVPTKLKLLNINAAAHLKLKGYTGAMLPPDSDVRNVPLLRSKDKQFLVSSVLDSFSNLFSSETYFRSNVNSGMGFLIDGECMLDSKCNPLPVGEERQSGNQETMTANKKSSHVGKVPTTRTKTGAPQKGTRIAVMVWDYRDMCHSSPDPNGVASLSIQLLEQAGYKVLSVPYTEYNPREKLVQKVKYLDQHLKSLVKVS